MATFAKIEFWGLKYPPEVLFELKTCNTICGTHLQTILNHKDLTGSAGGAKNSQNWVFLKVPVVNSFSSFNQLPTS